MYLFNLCNPALTCYTYGPTRWIISEQICVLMNWTPFFLCYNTRMDPPCGGSVIDTIRKSSDRKRQTGWTLCMLSLPTIWFPPPFTSILSVRVTHNQPLGSPTWPYCSLVLVMDPPHGRSMLLLSRIPLIRCHKGDVLCICFRSGSWSARCEEGVRATLINRQDCCTRY